MNEVQLPHPLRNAAKLLDPAFVRGLLHENAPISPLCCIDVQHSFMPDTGGLAVTDTGRYLRALPPPVQRFPQYNISHSSFWKDKSGDPPKPFTTITAKDVIDGLYTPTSGKTSEVQDQLDNLANNITWPTEE